MERLRAAMRSRDDSEGFTLIELIIAVVIVGILTAVAIPSYGAIQQTAKQNAVREAVSSEFQHSLGEIYQGKQLTPYETHKDGDKIWIEVLGADYRQPITESNIRVIGIWADDLKKGDERTYSNRYIGTLVDIYDPVLGINAPH